MQSFSRSGRATCASAGSESLKRSAAAVCASGWRGRSGALVLLCAAVAALAGGRATSLVAQETVPGAAATPQTAVSSNGEAAVPSLEAAQQRLEAVRNDAALAEDVKASLVQSWTETIESLAAAASAEQQRTMLEQRAASAPTELAEVADRLEQKPPPLELSVSPWSSVEEISSAKQTVEADVEVVRQELESLKSEINRRQEEMRLLPQRLADLQSAITQLEGTPVAVSEETDPAIAEAKRAARQAELNQLNAELALARQKSKTYPAESELLTRRVELLTRRAGRLQRELAELNQLLANQRQAQLQELTSDFASRVVQASAGYQEQAAETVRMLEQWSATVQGILSSEKELLDLRSQVSGLQTDFTSTQQIVETDLKDGELSRSSAFLLQRKRSQLPSPTSLTRARATNADRIEKAQMLESQLEARLDALPEDLAALADDEDASLVTQLRARERALLVQMRRDVDEYINNLISIGVAQSSYRSLIEEYAEFVDRHLLWIRDAVAFKLSDFVAAWHAFRWLVHSENLSELATYGWNACLEKPLPIALWLLLTCGLLVASSRMRRRVRELGAEATKRTNTDMRPTWYAIIYTVALSLAPAVALGIPGYVMSRDLAATAYVQALGIGLFVAAALVLPLEFMRQTVRVNGLAIAHYGWPSMAADPLRRNLRWMIDLGVPLVIAWQMVSVQEEARAIFVPFARLLFVSLMVLVAIVLWRIAHPRKGAARVWIINRPGGWIDRLRYVWHPALVAVPLLLAAMSLYGYRYSSTLLAGYLYKTLWMMTATLLAGGLIMRWLLLTRRRMTLAQYEQRMEARTAKEGQDKSLVDNIVEHLDEPEIDVAAVNAQTRQMVDAFLVTAVLVGLYFIWRPVVPALELLNDWELWTIDGTDGVEVITLANLLLMLPIVVLTFVAVRNVPGLLETTILQRLPLENAARYAITTLGSYTLAAVGIVAAANTLGIHWSNIQWLVAALGVGLGFGLQEIFANFVSGLILLFEQPIRVGDVVTIDGTTGVVSKIRMRATMVTNWDRQELVIPNKDLITGRLINWTLSDATNRAVVNVGIAYGSNVPQAIEILKQICSEHPNLLNEPEPVVTFEGFGDSTLALVLRAYLSSLDNRLQTISDLHLEINRRFAEAGIEIAFPQRDLHIRSLPKDFARLFGGQKIAPEDARESLVQ